MSKRTRKRSKRWRAVKFWIIQHLLLPIALVIARLWLRTIRIPPDDLAAFDDFVAEAKDRRVVVATYHGLGIILLKIAKKARRAGLNVVVLTSPSRDGLLMAKVVQKMGLTSVPGSSKNKAVSGTLGLLESLRKGSIVILAVDGPRGPRAVPKWGAARIARLSKAAIWSVVGAAEKSYSVSSWDRYQIPRPFTNVHFRFTPIEANESEDNEIVRLRMFDQMIADGKAIGSPIVEDIEGPELAQEDGPVEDPLS